MKLKEFNLDRMMFPKNPTNVDFFKAAVFYVLADGKIHFNECDDKEVFNEPKVKAIMKKAVPGHNSTLLNLEIMCNVNQVVIKDKELSFEEKIQKIATSIRKYVIT